MYIEAEYLQEKKVTLPQLQRGGLKLRGKSMNNHFSLMRNCVAGTLFTHRWCNGTDFPFYFIAL